jgi:hypothetical protein
MGVLNRFIKYRIEPDWVFSTSGVLWRLMMSQDKYLIGEDRNLDLKIVTFFCLDQKTGKVLWKGKELEEKWWIGLESIQNNVLFLHGYAAPDMPNHKKIIALDIQTGKLLWRNDDIGYLCFSGDSIFVSKDLLDKRIYYEVNPNDGHIIRETSPTEINRISGKASDGENDLRIFPEVIDPCYNHNEELGNIIKKVIIDKKNIQMIEYIKMPAVFIITYYQSVGTIPNSPEFNQEIVIVNRNTVRVRYQNRMNSNVKAPHPETYFSIGDYVYYIKERKTLTAILIPAN